MKEPNWARVISFVYANGGYYYVPFDSLESFDKDDQINDHEASLVAGEKLRKELADIEAWEMGTILNLLNRTNLMRMDIDEYGITFRLTKEGFDIAHERELRIEQQEVIERQTKATDTLADFTIILGITALVQALAAVYSVPRFSNGLAGIYLILLIILYFKRDDWFHGFSSASNS